MGELMFWYSISAIDSEVGGNEYGCVSVALRISVVDAGERLDSVDIFDDGSDGDKAGGYRSPVQEGVSGGSPKIVRLGGVAKIVARR